MPARGAGALDSGRIGRAGGIAAHRGVTAVKVAIDGNVGFVVARGITVGFGIIQIRVVGRDFHTVGIVAGAEVLLHPALVADSHRGIFVAVVVADLGGAAHEHVVLHLLMHAVDCVL